MDTPRHLVEAIVPPKRTKLTVYSFWTEEEAKKCAKKFRKKGYKKVRRFEVDQ